MKKAIVYVLFKDGSAHIAECKLKNNLSFGKKEMNEWIKEKSLKPVKQIQILSSQFQKQIK